MEMGETCLNQGGTMAVKIEDQRDRVGQRGLQCNALNDGRGERR
jgi:hypothetical protein